MSPVVLVLWCFLLWVGASLVTAYLRRRRLESQIEWIPGPPALPFIGVPQLINTNRTGLFKLLHECYKKYGSVYKLWLGNVPYIYLQDPESAKILLTDSENITKADEYRISETIVGSGLLMTTGEKWFHTRKLLTPSFHFQVLESVPETIFPDIRKFISIIKQESADDGSPIDILPYLQRLFLDTIQKTIIGMSLESQDGGDRVQAYIDAVDTLASIFLYRVFYLNYKWEVTYKMTELYQKQKVAHKTFMEFSNEAIKTRKEQIKNAKFIQESNDGKKGRMALFDTLLSAQESYGLTDEHIRDEVTNFLFAGYDTSSTTTSFALFLFGNHPDVQKKILEELDALCPNFIEEGITYKELNQLEYLDRCLKEVMRVLPPVDLIGRKTTSPVKLVQGVIPAGVNVYINLYNCHYNPNEFPDPERFDPDRFLKDNMVGRDPFAYIPFSAGSRNCIGMKFAYIGIKITLLMILKSFKIKSVEKLEDLQLYSNIVVTSETGIKLKLNQR